MFKNLILTMILLFSLEILAYKVNLGWDEVEITDPVIIDLINSKAFQRLKYVDQSGPTRYFGIAFPFSRYDHSIGVWYLAKKFGAQRDEQVAALLHDVSHTAFSHLAETVFKHENHEKSYQDLIHLEYISNSDIMNVVKKYNITLDLLDPDREEYKILERPLPDICADRLQYNLYTALKLEKLTKEEIQELLSHLHYENEIWYFDDQIYAKLFAEIPLYLNQHFWSTPVNNVVYHYFSKAILRGFEIDLFTEDDFHTGTDIEILSLLNSTDDEIIKDSIDKCQNINSNFKLITKDDEIFLNFKPKFRGIDPYVCSNGNCSRLSSIDADFKEKYENVKEWCSKGYNVKLGDV